MKKTTLTGVMSLSALVLLSSCGEDLPNGGGTGTGLLAPVVNLDTEVMASSRATDESASRAADEISVDDLRIKVASADDDGASFSQTWNSLAEFPLDQKFKVGTYNVTAFYGDPAVEGFEMPAYSGTQRVTVAENQTSEVSIEARLVNAMISVEYTEAFQNYMNDWSASVAGGDASNPVAFVTTETRPAYIQAGPAKVYVSFTKPNGVSATLEVASIEAKACHHYHVGVDVNGGGAGSETLEITFDADVDREVTVDIPLDDDILNAPAPELSAEGFVPGEAVSFAEGMVPDGGDLKMNIIARGGIASVTMTTTSASLLSKGWPASIDLAAASSSQQSALTELGLGVLGLWKNLGEMAVIDFSRVLPNIAYMAGTDNRTEFSIVVTDRLRKVSEPLTLSVVLDPVTLTLAEGQGAFNPGDDYTLSLSYNGADVENSVKVQYRNNRGTWTNATIRSITAASRAATLYDVTIATPEIDTDLILRAVCGSVTSDELTVKQAPFNVSVAREADVFATRATLTVSGQEESGAALASRATLYMAESDGDYAARQFSDNGDGTIAVAGLNPATAYRARIEVDGRRCAPATFTTETALGVPNGDFEELVQTINVSNMQSGGLYTRVVLFGGDMQNHSSFTVSEPRGWASTNGLTCNLSSSNQNTWFVTPSVFNSTLFWQNVVDTQGGMGGQKATPSNYQGHSAASGEVAMLLRNVAWDPAGTNPDRDKKTAGPDNYYCRNTPSSIARTTAGRMYLATFAEADNKGSHTEGVAFTSRPSALAGQYKYVRDGNDGSEMATVNVEILAGQTVIASGAATLDAAGDYTAFNVPLTYTRSDLKATGLRVAICSSNRAEADIKTTKYAQLHRQEANGAVLTVDKLTFNY